MNEPTAEEIAERLIRAVPESVERTVDVEPDCVLIECPGQSALGGTMSISWSVGDGWQFNIYAPLLIYEAWSLERTEWEETERFATLVEDLFAGRIRMEIDYFRKSGKHWRTRMIDPRLPPADQVIQTYHRLAFRWFRAVRTESVSLKP